MSLTGRADSLKRSILPWKWKAFHFHGKVENLVKFVKTSFFSARQFESVDEIHEPLAAWLPRRAA